MDISHGTGESDVLVSAWTYPLGSVLHGFKELFVSEWTTWGADQLVLEVPNWIE